MSTDPTVPGHIDEVTDEPMIVIGTGYPVTFAAGHRMRAARCPVCGELIGGRTATVVGFADISRDPCTCRYIGAAVFVVHTDCAPEDEEDMTEIVGPFAVCQQPHH